MNSEVYAVGYIKHLTSVDENIYSDNIEVIVDHSDNTISMFADLDEAVTLHLSQVDELINILNKAKKVLTDGK